MATAAPPPPPPSGVTAVQDRAAASANLLQLLPSGTVMAYQILASSFNNGGKCYSSNWYITIVLLVMLSLTSVFLVLTDSFTYEGKLYYGLATPLRLKVFNVSTQEEMEVFEDIEHELRRRRLKRRDILHAFLVVFVFLAVAFTDVGIQNCFFPVAGTNTQQLLRNLPLGVGVLCSGIFLILPSRRKFFGSSDPTTIAAIPAIQRVPALQDIESPPVPSPSPATEGHIV